MDRWIAFVERRRWHVLGASLLLCALCALSLTRLRLDVDLLGTLPQGRPAFDDFKVLIAEFGQLDELIVLLEGPETSELQSMADALAARFRGSTRIETVDYRVEIDAIADVILDDHPFHFLNDAGFAELERRITPEGIDRQLAANHAALAAPLDLSAAAAIANDPLGVGRLVLDGLSDALGGSGGLGAGGYYLSADGGALLLMLRPRGSAFDIAFSQALLAEVRATVDEVCASRPAWQKISVRYTGSYAFALEDAATMRSDIRLFTVLSLLGVLLVFLAGYRSVRILPFVTYPLVVTTLVTFALSSILYDQLNALSLCFAAILYGLSIDSGIHFYTRLVLERRTHELREAVARTLAHLGVANIVASSTTAAAFAVAGFSCLSAVSQLGWLTAIGMVINSALFFVLYPTLALVMPRASVSRIDPSTPRLGRLGEWCAQHGRPLLAAAAVLAIGAGVLAVGVVSDVHLTRLRPSGSEAATVQERIADRFAGRGAAAAVLVEAADAETALQGAEDVGGTLRRYRQEGLLRSLRSADAFLPSQRTQQRRIDRFLGLDRAAVVTRLRDALPRHGFKAARFEAAFDSLEERPRGVLRPGDPALRAMAPLLGRHLRERSGRWIAATYLEPADGVNLHAIGTRLRADLSATPHRFASRELLEGELSVVLRTEFVAFIVIAVAGNLVLALLMLRSLRVTFGVLAPVVLAVLCLFAFMSLTGVPLDPVNLVVAPMVLGLGVDYGVYVAAGERGNGIGPALREGGRALVVSAATTIAGFTFLGFSNYPALAWLGILTGVGLAIALLLTVVLLPAAGGIGSREAGSPTAEGVHG